MDPSAPNAFAPPPPGLNYIEALKPSLTMLIIGSVWSAILVPLLFALFFFSTKELRRKPIFILNSLLILLGISMGLMNGVLEVEAILLPLKQQNSSSFIAFGTVIITIPIIVESILVLRLLAVYPPRRTTLRLTCAIFIPLALIRVARIVNAAIFLSQYEQITKNISSPIASVIDNTATSCLFLYRLQWGKKLASDSGRVEARSRYSTYSNRLRGLIWISASNFIFPVILSLCQLILLYRDPDYLKGTYIFICNDYVEIIGVLLATVWSASSNRADNNTANVSIPTIRFGTGSGSTANRTLAITTH